jgi:AGZA family xanthine/uracil permease-like MFS transporter
MNKSQRPSPLRILPGDINGLLALSVDNLSVMALLAGILIGGFGVPADIVFSRMLPGTAFGVLVGDLLYSFLAARLARRTGRADVTAMPFGLDTPSTIGMAVLVLGPAFARFRAAGLDPVTAGLETWYLGMAATVVMGLVKIPLSFTGRSLRRIVPQAGLLGSLAGIALMLIGFLPIVELMQSPVVGFLSLGLVLYSLVAKGRIPGNLPGVLFAVLIGTALYYVLSFTGFSGMAFHTPALTPLKFSLPHADAGILHGFALTLVYLPLLVPFALLTIIGGINNTESARVAGDDYDVRSILLAEAIATLAAGLVGGVAQTTPYIGHPAYKQMGARVAYTWLTGLCIGIGGMFGLLSNLLEWIPIAVLAPVLIYVALDMTVQAFKAIDARHSVAVAFGFFPAIARMVTIELSDPNFLPIERFNELLTTATNGLPQLAVIVSLGNGFIITSTIWTATVAEMIDRKLRNAAAFLAAGSLLCCFGIIHSVRADGSLYAIWQLSGVPHAVAVQFCTAYAGLALTLLVLSILPVNAPPTNNRGA